MAATRTGQSPCAGPVRAFLVLGERHAKKKKSLKTKCCHPVDVLHTSGSYVTSYVTGDLCLVLILFSRHSTRASAGGCLQPPIYNCQPRCTLDIWKLRCQSGHLSTSVMICSATGWKDAKVKGITPAFLSPRDHLVKATCQQAASSPWAAPSFADLSQRLHRPHLLTLGSISASL